MGNDRKDITDQPMLGKKYIQRNREEMQLERKSERAM